MNQPTPVTEIDLRAPVTKQELLQVMSLITNIITTMVGDDNQAKVPLLKAAGEFSRRLIDGR